MIRFFKLIRLPDLLLIALVQCLLRWFIMDPILKLKGFELQTDNFEFCLLVLSTLLLAAAGYVINDYFDRKTDLINRPHSVLVRKSVTGRYAIVLHSVLNFLAVTIGIIAVARIGLYRLSVIYIIIPFVLWQYSVRLKRQFLTGNLVIALFVAFIPLIVALFEIPLLRNAYHSSIFLINDQVNNMFVWIAGYSFFAFLVALIYMMIKDIEDYKGDVEDNRHTLPVVLGVHIAKMTVLVLTLIIVFLSAWIVESRLNDMLTIIYYLLAVIIPVVLMLVFLLRSDRQADYRRAVITARIILLSGVFYMFIAGYIINQQILH
ncbi:MAG: geranylgeranylglycerol-phosphate geranylgeranyltransferase [Bacteroidia bacterium]|nr:geranylgeranylglycerol-phosphate geranylgeranyltransferase [Bacteroidia bacterium]